MSLDFEDRLFVVIICPNWLWFSRGAQAGEKPGSPKSVSPRDIRALGLSLNVILFSLYSNLLGVFAGIGKYFASGDSQIPDNPAIKVTRTKSADITR